MDILKKNGSKTNGGGHVFIVHCPLSTVHLLIIHLLVIICLSSCVTNRKTHYLQEPDKSIPNYPEVYTPMDYQIQKSDELNIRVITLDPESRKVFNAYGSSSGSSTGMSNYASTNSKGLYTYTVYDDGTIDFPYIGAIEVAGKTTREVKNVIEEKLVDYVKDCSVEVNLVNSYYNIITNNKAGRYQITKEKMTIFEALAVAGDLNEFSDRKNVQIMRQNLDGTTTIRKFDLRSKSIIGSEFYYIQPNDIIYVKSFGGQYFRINHFLTALGVTTTTISFGLLIWQIVKLCIPK